MTNKEVTDNLSITETIALLDYLERITGEDQYRAYDSRRAEGGL